MLSARIEYIYNKKKNYFLCIFDIIDVSMRPLVSHRLYTAVIRQNFFLFLLALYNILSALQSILFWVCHYSTTPSSEIVTNINCCYIYINRSNHFYQRTKWIQWFKIKFQTKLLVFHLALILLVFSVQLWINRRVDLDQPKRTSKRG